MKVITSSALCLFLYPSPFLSTQFISTFGILEKICLRRLLTKSPFCKFAIKKNIHICCSLISLHYFIIVQTEDRRKAKIIFGSGHAVRVCS